MKARKLCRYAAIPRWQLFITTPLGCPLLVPNERLDAQTKQSATNSSVVRLLLSSSAAAMALTLASPIKFRPMLTKENQGVE